jgi:hypothetical protein
MFKSLLCFWCSSSLVPPAEHVDFVFLLDAEGSTTDDFFSESLKLSQTI